MSYSFFVFEAEQNINKEIIRQIKEQYQDEHVKLRVTYNDD